MVSQPDLASTDLPTRLTDVPASVGPVQVSGVRVGVGLVIGAVLLGQSFLNPFGITLSERQMTFTPKSG
jgi:hypothetical protein